MVITNVLIDSAVEERDVVFYNQATGKYEQALAGAVYRSGLFENIASSVAVGIMIRTAGTVGDVMVGGFDVWLDSDKITGGMLEPGLPFKSGVPYFLSPYTPGKLTNVPPSYRVQVLVATDTHFVLAPAYSTLDSFEDNFPVALGMRPVGSLRPAGEEHQLGVVVGFDGLEKNATTGLWSPTTSVADHAANGWVLADATLTVKPSASFFVRIQTVGSVLKVYRANTLAALSNTTDQIGSDSTLLGTNYTTVRDAALVDPQGITVGTLHYRFTSADVAKDRQVVLQIPESFQGWKMINTPSIPRAIATVVGGVLTSITVTNPGVGFSTPPKVVLTNLAGGGTGASATAVLDENGGIASISVDVGGGGSGYTNTTAGVVTFDSRISSLKILNGGSSAVLSLTVAGGAIIAVTVSNRGSNYWVPPLIEVVDATGVGTGAILRAVVQDGEVVGVEIAEAGSSYAGSGNTTAKIMPSYYGYLPNEIQVKAVGGGGTGSSVTAVTPNIGLRLVGVRVDCGGIGYTSTPTLVASSGLAVTQATFKVVVDANGTVVRVIVLTGGSGYGWTPTLTVGNVGAGNGLRLTPLMETDISGLTVSNPGTGFRTLPRIEVGVPLRELRLEHGGNGYTTAESYPVAIATSDFGNTNATGIAYRGGKVTSVIVTEAGSGHSTPDDDFAQFTIPTFDGAWLVTHNTMVEFTGLVQLQPLFIGGTLVDVKILRAGRGLLALKKYTREVVATTAGSTDTVNLTAHGLVNGQRVSFLNFTASGLVDGTTYFVTNASANTFQVSATSGGAAFNITTAVTDLWMTSMDSYAGTVTNGTGAFEITVGAADEIAEVVLTNRGNGYTKPPRVTLAAVGGNDAAQFSTSLQGVGLMVQPTLSGLGGRWNTDTLQSKTWVDDFPGDYIRPKTCGFYYNVKADPEFRSRWPAHPLEKCVVIANGVELRTAVVDATSGLLAAPADIGLLSKTLAWNGLARQGAPWDATYQSLMNDVNSEGDDAIYQPTAGDDQGWRWWPRLHKNAGNLSTGIAHTNKTSRFYQSGRVQSLTVLSPLKLVDTLIGLDNIARPGPMTGQLMLSIDTEENLLSPWSQQIDMMQAGGRVPIYQNITGRPVFIRSLQLRSVFQSSALDGVPVAANAGTILVGTAVGNYRNILGSPDPTLVSTPGVSVKLFGNNQIKELFPDNISASPVILPGETVYLQVEAPASSPIVTQLVVVRIMGHVL